MPSHRGEPGAASVQLHTQSSYWLSCTPQAHCRSEPLSYHGANLTPIVDMEGWFPATSGFELTTRNGSPPGLHNFQQPSEMPMSCADDGVEINTGGVFPLTDYQSETWWPPINVQVNVQAAIQRDILSAPHGGSVDRKPAASTVPFTSGYNMELPRLEPWCPEVSNPVAVANVDSKCDLNAPSCDRPTSALTAVTTAVVAAGIVPSPSPSPSPVAAAAGPSRQRATKAGGSRKGKSVSAPTSPSELRAGATDQSLAVQKSKGSSGKRPLTQRQNHIWSERQRRKGMNYLFESLRSLLPHPSPTNKTDKSTVVGEIIKYIQALQVQLEMLTKKQQQMLAARTLSASPSTSPFRGIETFPRAFVSNGLTLVDHSSNPSSMTAITALPPPGRESCLQSYLGANVGLHACGLNVFITTSSPRGRRGLFHELLVTIHKHDLDVINANISTSNASIFHCLHCQASQDAELLNNDLHHALQSVINQFG